MKKLFRSRKSTILTILGIVCVIIAFSAYYVFGGPKKTEVKIKMRDGVHLATDVFVPGHFGKYPTVLVRTPYNKVAEEWMGKAFKLFRIAVVVQDTRGKYNSEGEFYPFVNEREDGLETLKWIRSQSWSDGTVAGWGGSYVGFTQWAISDSLDFLTLLLTGAKLYDFVYPDTLFSLQTAYLWGTENASAKTNKIEAEKKKSALLTLPVSAADDSTIMDINFYNDWLIHNKYDEYWQKLDFRGETKAPILSMAGWQDLFLKAQIDDFEALSKTGNPGNRLVIGPWVHGSMGEKNEYGGLDKTGKPTLIFNYVRRFLKGKKSKLAEPLKDTKYNLFVMERNEYVGSEVWPPSETHSTPYYIGPSGYLNTQSYAATGNLGYIYKPSDPYPSHGGTALGEGVGPAKQNENVSRTDQLVFEMKIDNEPLVLLGPVSATLWLTSDVPCTQFIVGIHDVFPDGKIINIQEGGANVKLNPTEPQKTEISVWATGYQLNPGHKLRVVISSGWFPRYNRSLNNCEPDFTATEMKDATQNLFFGPNTPSCLNLPVYKIK
jgi:putative CocE/NonD family hydrolase